MVNFIRLLVEGMIRKNEVIQDEVTIVDRCR